MTSNPPIYSVDPEDYLTYRDPPAKVPVLTQGTDIEGFDSLPEPIREYLATPDAGRDWSAKAIQLRIRITGSVEETVEWLRVADENRRLAAYRELGFDVDPKTGKPIG